MAMAFNSFTANNLFDTNSTVTKLIILFHENTFSQSNQQQIFQIEWQASQTENFQSNAFNIPSRNYPNEKSLFSLANRVGKFNMIRQKNYIKFLPPIIWKCHIDAFISIEND